MLGLPLEVFRNTLLPMLAPAQVAVLGAMSPRVLARVWDALFKFRTAGRFAHAIRCSSVRSPEMAEQFMRDRHDRDLLMLNLAVVSRSWLSMNPDAPEPATDDEDIVDDGVVWLFGF